MSAGLRFRSLFWIACLLLILPQCSDKNSSDYVKEGLQYIEEQNFQRAETSFKQALSKNPKNPEAFYGLGGIYNAQGRYPEAEESFKKALRNDPTHVDAHYSLGYTYEQMGKTELAEKHFAMYKRLKAKYADIMNKEDASP